MGQAAVTIEKTMPHSQDAERALLAAGILDNATLPVISECVKAEDFFIPQNRVIYLAQMGLAAAGQPVDLVTLVETLQRSDELEKAGGGAYVSSIIDGYPKIQNVKHHAAIVKENAQRRRVVHTCHALGQAAMEGEESRSVLERGAQEFLAMMSADGAASLPHKWSEAVYAAMEQVVAGIRDPGKMMRIFCGIPKLDEAFGGFRRQEVVLCVGMTSHGKAQPLTATVMTPSGPMNMGQIRTGDFVIGADGLPVQVLAIHPQGNKDVFRITFSDGAVTECCKEHLWSMRSRQGKYGGYGWKLVSTESLLSRCEDQFIPMCGSVQFENVRLPIDPYVLGALLGDGGLTGRTPCVTIADKGILEEFSNRLPCGIRALPNGKFGFHLTKERGRRCGANVLTLSLRRFGLMGLKSPNKFVPQLYLLSSAYQRELLLQGLLDTDGTVSKYGRKTGHCIEFSTTSEKLGADVRFIVRSLGGTATLTRRTTSFTHKSVKKNGRESLRIMISLPPNIVPFKSKRKLAVYLPACRRGPNRSIRSIESVGFKPCQCITVSAKNGLYLTDDFIVTHNSLISMQFGTHADTHGYKGMVISAEMSKEALASRELAYTAKVPLYYLRRPEKLHHPDAIIAKLTVAAGEESRRKLLVVDRDITPSRIWSLCELVHRAQGLDFVIVDYDQLVVRAGLKGNEDEFSAQAKFMANALELAKRLDLCFILLCQPRKVDEDVARGKKPPRVEQIFGSSAVANTAHVIFWIMRKFFQKGMDPVYEKVAQTFILKARNDKTGTIDHGFDPDLVRFVNEQEVIIESPEEESRAAKRKKAKKGESE